MSNSLAIATVSAVLQARVEALLNRAGISGMNVSTDHPQVDPDPGVYIKLYAVLPNVTMRNIDTPTRRADGSLNTRPRLAINLHYLFSFVGDAGVQEPERLAGIVLTDMHARPQLDGEEIADLVTSLAAAHPLKKSDLADQVERVRLTPRALDLENLSRLWSLLNQSYYGLSVGYEASVVLLDADVVAREALPVARRNVAVVASKRPVIRSVRTATSSEPAASLGDTLWIDGQSLSAEVTHLRIGAQRFPIDWANRRDHRLQIEWTAAMNLAAGLHAVQVIHGLDLGEGQWRDGATSNPAVVALVPAVSVPADPLDALGGGRFDVTLSVQPVPTADQEVEVILSSIASNAASHSTKWRVEGANVVFTLPELASQTYLVRVRVDGATSILARNDAGVYVGPAVVVP